MDFLAMIGQESNFGRRDTRTPLNSLCIEGALLLLPETVLERILLATGQKGELRFVCKAFSVTISKSVKDLKLPREILRNHGFLIRALATFPSATRIVLDLSCSRMQPARSNSYLVVEDDDGDAALLASTLDALAKLRHPLTSLAVLNLSSPLPLPSTAALAYLTSCSLVELRLQDVSIEGAASDGAANLLRSIPQSLACQSRGGSRADSIRARGAAMVQLACSLPCLRRLSLCNAAFSSFGVAALSGLTNLEELSLVGAMECVAPLAPDCPEAAHPQLRGQRPKLLEALAAVPVHKQLLAALPRLRSLHLPMAISISHGRELGGNFSDSDDDDVDLGGAGFGGRLGLPGSGNETASRTAGPEGALRRFDKGGAHLYVDRDSKTQISFHHQTHTPMRSGTMEQGDVGARFAAMCGCAMDRACMCCWSFPRHLEELTIPLCSRNGPIFRAACEVYGGMDNTYGGGEGGGARPAYRHLRALRITCAPGFTASQGSFLNVDGDFAALARLAPSLESLHFCLELGASGRNALRRDRLRRCLRHLRALHRLKDLRISETQQPTCFAVRKVAATKQDFMSYLLDESDEAARLCGDVRLPLLPLLGDRTYVARPWNGGLLLAPLAVPPPRFALAPAPVSSSSSGPGRCIDSLLTHWPHLEMLSVCGQCVFSSSSGGQNRLVAPESGAGIGGGECRQL